MINVRLGSLTYFGRRLSFLLRSSTVSNGRCDGNRDSSSSSALSNDWQSSKYGFTPKQIGGNQGQSKPAINGLAAGGSGYIVASFSVSETANHAAESPSGGRTYRVVTITQDMLAQFAVRAPKLHAAEHDRVTCHMSSMGVKDCVIRTLRGLSACHTSYSDAPAISCQEATI